jgi:hypothetical protein
VRDEPPAQRNGRCCENCDIAPLASKEDEVRSGEDAIRQLGSMPLGVMPYAVDPEAADRPWNVSERLIGSTIQ